MKKKRVACFIDGFNLYHAIDKLNKENLKWFDLNKLMHQFADPSTQEILDIFYFTAYAKYRGEDSLNRHRNLVTGLINSKVKVIFGEFKEKDRECKKCGNKWKGHEEKQTDVNVALYIVKGALLDEYDEAFVVTQDSDIAPAIKMINKIKPHIKVKIITPPNIPHSRELSRLAGKTSSIKENHLEMCRLPEKIYNKKDILIAECPEKWMPNKK